MKILHVNKFLYRRGGAESYMLDLAGLQQDAGHSVAFYSMRHPENLPSRFAAYFPANVELEPMPPGIWAKAEAAGRVLFSPAALRGMARVVREFRPDIVHLHNIYHQLSPSILRPVGAAEIPAVMTLHDYKLACPTYRFLDKGEICEACLGGHFHQALLRRCNRGSIAASGLNALEMSLHFASGAYDPIRLFLCPSAFMESKMREAGVYPDRLRHVPLFVESRGIETKSQPGGPVVFAGRLSPEKGVDVLIRAAGSAGVHLEIAGDGPVLQGLRKLAEQVADGLVTFLGHLPLSDLQELLRGASVSVLPARWYENQPLSILDAFAAGVPAIGSKLGGIPELIEDRVDGYLFPSEDVPALSARLSRIADMPGTAFEMGLAGRRKAEDHFSPELHLDRLHAAYAEASAAPA